ncbi:hypothetical protein GPECTOR_73g630 [Gonium pectorale]|uniref:Uncharacterized protein n=1 Tax=Gonium pectorale TaxID=33097 RepID=A0A150G2K5_GONPE|nr:hypothetical protein GPECTOR_73g630 [Gonium pectorale]|eukprot:KXZ44109.1 hypothetical protein GPECTOR_73g630 [Gonium pectorale]
MAEGLLALGADATHGARRGRITAIHLACWLGHTPLVVAMLRCGEEQQAQQPGGDGEASAPVTPHRSTHEQLQRRRRQLADVQDAAGFTPLHYAAAAGHADVAAVLLGAGASYNLASTTAADPAARMVAEFGGAASAAAAASGAASGRGHGRLRAALSHHLHTLPGVLRVTRGAAATAAAAAAIAPVLVAPRSSALHLAALRGDDLTAAVILQRFQSDAEAPPSAGGGGAGASRFRVVDPRRQLNKDGFQPYMLAGNAGHWPVAQLLIPVPMPRGGGRGSGGGDPDEPASRERDFLRFFPLPSARPAGGAAGGGAVGPPPLRDLAARAWAAKLLADVAEAEADTRQRQQELAAAAAAAAGGGGGGAAPGVGDTGSCNAGGVFSAIFRGRSKSHAPACSGSLLRRSFGAGEGLFRRSSRPLLLLLPASPVAMTAAATSATAVTAGAAATDVGGFGDCSPAGPTPRTSIAGAITIAVGGAGAAPPAAAAAANDGASEMTWGSAATSPRPSVNGYAAGLWTKSVSALSPTASYSRSQ